ncbi:TIGR03862 family flavoprotein [Planktotalea sp.]|uniref:TIGR03862 family flavoprotein n=1 Tax=Planktotalea sp. TaxID=2029877 RepID=UPI003D6B4568
MSLALVIGGGPAGLMAADELSRAGAQVIVLEAKASIGRKFLMAGKSGLNLTKDEPISDFVTAYTDAKNWLNPMVADFGSSEVMRFTEQLGQSVFTGSSGRVFPKAMKASPMLRAWIEKLTSQGVEFRTKWRWLGWANEGMTFETPEGKMTLEAEAVVFALGGSSWSRLGSDGAWAQTFKSEGIELAPFGPSNSSISIAWSAFMAPHFGTPIKSVAFTSGPYKSRGEAIISKIGLEGGGVYSISRGVREGHPLFIDLRPDLSVQQIATALQKERGKASLSNHMRRVLKIKKYEMALINEWARPLPNDPAELAKTVKQLRVGLSGLGPMDDAISTSGGIKREAFDENLMLRAKQGVFCAGEMLDWEAPTGGYLLTACFASGRTAGRGAARYLGLTPAPERA